MKTYKEAIREAYKEWRGIFDDSFTKEYNANGVRFKICSYNDESPLICFIQEGVDGFFGVATIPNKMHAEIFCEYEKSYPYQLLIDNTDKDSTFLRYLDERFATESELKNKLSKIIAESEKKINMIGVYYQNECSFWVHFTDKNKIERVTASLRLIPNIILGDIPPNTFECDSFISACEILTEHKKRFLMTQFLIGGII